MASASRKMKAARACNVATTAAKPVPAAPADPMSTRYRERFERAKKRYPRHLIAFRMGDFIEFYYGDAEVVAKALGNVLTTRAGAAMCCIPSCWQGEQRLARLQALGHRVQLVGRKQKKMGGDLRSVTKAEHKRLVESGFFERARQEIEAREKIGRLAAELGRLWVRQNEADASRLSPSASAADRIAADRLKADALGQIEHVEQAMAAVAPHDARDAMALALLLFDRLEAIGGYIDDERVSSTHLDEARSIAANLARFLASEAHSTPSAIGMRAYARNLEKLGHDGQESHADARTQ